MPITITSRPFKLASLIMTTQGSQTAQSLASQFHTKAQKSISTAARAFIAKIEIYEFIKATWKVVEIFSDSAYQFHFGIWNSSGASSENHPLIDSKVMWARKCFSSRLKALILIFFFTRSTISHSDMFMIVLNHKVCLLARPRGSDGEKTR